MPYMCEVTSGSIALDSDIAASLSGKVSQLEEILLQLQLDLLKVRLTYCCHTVPTFLQTLILRDDAALNIGIADISEGGIIRTTNGASLLVCLI
ncbi:hypothetical protein GOODEAATRI_026748 [Goodea atripinnis]|uniref:Uncharacterized protein n=1 Tax=Goodea atripinnis TaxID=208336 RepID=A0ABV0P824_9TELE